MVNDEIWWYLVLRGTNQYLVVSSQYDVQDADTGNAWKCTPKSNMPWMESSNTQGLLGFCYPLVNVYIIMEHHIFSWVY